MKYIIYLLICLSICSACENIISYDNPNYKPQLIINALLTTDDSSSNYVFLSLSGIHEVEEIKDGKIDVYINDQYVETLEYIHAEKNDEDYFPTLTFSGYLLNTKLKSGDQVKIEASTKDGKYSAWAENTIPLQPEIVKIDTASLIMKDITDEYSSYEDYYCLKITIKDLPGRKNYYRLIVKKYYNINISYTDDHIPDWEYTTISNKYIGWGDIALTNNNPFPPNNTGIEFRPRRNIYGIFDNSYFINDLYTLVIYVNKDIGYSIYSWDETIKEISIESDITIAIQHLTEIEYKYLQALNYYDDEDADDVAFDYPVIFPSNVNGGQGILGTAAQTNSSQIIIEKGQYKTEEEWSNRQ